MEKTKTLKVPQWEADQMELYCLKPPMPDHNVPKDSPVFDTEVQFDNGHRVAIQVIASNEPDKESCWVQGVLFEENGQEIACTDVGESFLGEYNLYDGDDLYIVNVEVE